MLAEGSVQLIISPAIMAEYANVLARKKFGLSPATVSMIFRSLRNLAIEVVPSEALHVCTDPEDDKFLECAVAAGVSWLVTGNLKHFPKLLGGIRIISPATFLRESDLSQA